MLKNFSPIVQIVFDIETAPCLETARRAYPQMQDMYETLEEELQGGSGITIPEIDQALFDELNIIMGATEENPQPFLKYFLHRVVSIVGVARRKVAISADNPIGIEVNMFTLPSDDLTVSEATIIHKFLNGVAERTPQLIGWNSIGFDLTVLHQRAIINKLSFPKLQRPSKPWEGADYFAKGSDMNLDLLDLISSHLGKSKATLGEFASACGIPGKMDVSGDQVAKLWFAGEYQKIIDYNECDAATTYLLWLEMLKFSGHVTEEDYMIERAMFRAILDQKAAAGAEHMTAFTNEWDRLQGTASVLPSA